MTAALSAPTGGRITGDRLRGWVGWLWFAVPAVVSVALRSAIPPVPLFGTSHDDYLMVRLANRLLDGQWLGAWDGLILSKGPGYPLYLAGTAIIGVPPMMLQQVVYLAGCLVLALAVSRVWGGAWLARITFIVLALNPAMIGLSASRVYREGLVAGLAVLAVGLAVSVPAFRGRSPRVEGWRLAGLILGLGLVLGLLRIVRADTIWILVAVGALVAIYPWGAGAGLRPRWWAGVGVVAVIGLASLLSLVPDRIVAGVNSARYGVALVEDHTQGALAQAWQAWVRVEPHSSDPRAPLSPEAIAAVFTASPTAARLARDTDPTEADTTVTGLSVPGSYAVWALRDRAGHAGVASAGQLQEFFGAVRSEVTAACADGRLTCTGLPVAAGMPVLQAWDVPGILRVARADLAEKWLGMAVAYPVAEVSERSPDYIGRLPGGTFPLDDGDEFRTWQRAVIGVRSPAGVLPPAGDPALRVQAALAEVYSGAWRLAWLPALLGLLLALLAPGRRIAAVTGWGLVLGVTGSIGILSAYSWHGGGWATYHYYLVAMPLALTATVLGVFCLGSLGAQVWRRRGGPPAAPAAA